MKGYKTVWSRNFFKFEVISSEFLSSEDRNTKYGNFIMPF